MDTLITTTLSGDEDLEAITHVARSDVGLRREENQDSFGIIDLPNARLFLVADGMGGARGGAVASKLAIEAFQEKLADADIESVAREDLIAAANEANDRIFKKGMANSALAGMGTTVVGLCFVSGQLYVINVGDSRAYRIRRERIIQLTQDHTLVSELVRSGAITESQVENHPVSHMLTRSLGPTPLVEIDCWPVPGNPGKRDIYLICSDGLYNLVSSSEMLEVITQYSAEEAADKLVKLANQRGGTDNITVLVIHIGEGFSLEAPEEDDVTPPDSDTLELLSSSGSLEDLDEKATPASDEKEEESNKVEGSSPHIHGSIGVDSLQSGTHRSPSQLTAGGRESVIEMPGPEGMSASARPLWTRGWGIAVLICIFSITAYFLGVMGSTHKPDGAAHQPFAREEGKDGQDIAARVDSDPGRAGSIDGDVKTEPAVQEQIRQQPPLEPYGAELNFFSSQMERNEQEELLTKIALLQSQTNKLAEQIASFDNPPAEEQAAELIASYERKIEEIRTKLTDVRNRINAANRGLKVWLGKRERFASTELTNMATEISNESERVKEKLREFQHTTWLYLKELDSSAYYPNDEERKASVERLLEQRKMLQDELREEVAAAIEQKVNSAYRNLAELDLERYDLERELEVPHRDLAYVHSLLTTDESLRQVKLEELAALHVEKTRELEQIREVIEELGLESEEAYMKELPDTEAEELMDEMDEEGYQEMPLSEELLQAAPFSEEQP